MFVDAHAHLDLYGESLDQESLDSALGEIAEHGILTLANSLDLPSYERNIEIARMSEFVIPLFGVHPWSAPDYVNRLGELADASDRTPMLGEIGLDHRFVTDESLYPAQREVFEFLLSAARELSKSVNLHTAGAESEVLTLLDEYSIDRVIVHWYSGPRDVFDALVERGALFSMGIDVVYTEHVRELAAAVPAELLLTETDNPGGPKSLLGRPGTPSLLLDVVDALAEIRGTTSEDIVATVERNFTSFVNADTHLSAACGRFFDWSR